MVTMSCGEIRNDAGRIEGGGFAGLAVDDERLAVFVSKEQAGILVEKHRRVGVAAQIVKVDPARLHEAVDH